MRLNWFSPLPPEQTDIAHYTARIADALMRRFDVVFWTDLQADPARMPPNAKIRFFDPARIEDREFYSEAFGGLNIYNFGNNVRFHAGIFRVAQRVPGIAVLHDTRMHHFVLGLSCDDRPPFASYFDYARELYGKSGAAAARRIVDLEGRTIDENLERMPFTELFLENAVATICHSKFAVAEISERADTPVLLLPLPFVSTANKPSARRVWAPPWHLIMFGYLGSNRRLENIIEALADLAGEFEFHLDIYGTLWNALYIQELIEQTGLADRISIHGFVPEQELDDALGSAHLAFNLRHPTMGEASGGILRSWAVGTPALVTNAGWYADLPDSIAPKISIENEIADIREMLLRLARAPAEFENVGLAAQSWLARVHAPDAYVEALAAALTNMRGLMARRAAREIILRTACNSKSPKEREVLLDRAATTTAALLGFDASPPT